MEEKKSKGEAFECRICLDSPVEPVVTKCGHLFWYYAAYNSDINKIAGAASTL